MNTEGYDLDAQALVGEIPAPPGAPHDDASLQAQKEREQMKTTLRIIALSAGHPWWRLPATLPAS